MKTGLVSLIGRPNAGKSTLLNRLVGTKLAIVSDKPQTTRNRILGVRNYEDAQVVFLDTPGIHRPLHRMNVRMVDAALETIREVDVLGLVVDAPEAGGKGDDFVLDLARQSTALVFLILNKIDLMKRSRLLPLIDAYRTKADFAEIVPVSAATGENVDRLERAIIDRLPEGEPMYPADYLTDQPERFFAREIVREKLLQFTRAEIPFSSAVVIDRFDEPDATPAGEEPQAGLAGGAGQVGRVGQAGQAGRVGQVGQVGQVGRGGPVGHVQGPPGRPPGGPMLKLYCTIVVDRESQKPIVVGRGGEMIKRIGMAAREDLERFFGARVFLDLHVRVKSEWREDDGVLSDLGL
jgi:GTP-binding protein Era